MALASGSNGQATAGGLAAPAVPATACGTGNGNKTTVTVTWSSVAHATGYTVLQSTTSATSGYTSAVTGQTGSSWTSGNLSAGNYWFEIQAVDGNWTSNASTAGPQRVIGNNNCS